MNNTSPRTVNLYQQRLDKERRISEEEVRVRMRWDLPILSTNQKCSVSLDLPMTHCIPTAVCAEVCYASQCQQYYRKCVVKSLAIDRLIELEPDHVARKMIDEAHSRRVGYLGIVSSSTLGGGMRTYSAAYSGGQPGGMAPLAVV